MSENLQSMAPAIAGALSTETGDTWTLLPSNSDNPRHVRVMGPRGMVLEFYAPEHARQPGRVYVSGEYPGRGGRRASWNTRADWNLRSARPISCALARGAAAIARDVARRFLVSYRVTFDQVRAAAAELARELETRDAVAAALRAEGFRVSASQSDRDNPEAEIHVHGWPNASIYPNGRVHVNGFTIDGRHAPAVLKVVRAFADENLEDPETVARRALEG